MGEEEEPRRGRISAVKKGPLRSEPSSSARKKKGDLERREKGKTRRKKGRKGE